MTELEQNKLSTGTDSCDDFKEGRIVLIDKPLKWSSFDAVNKIRILLRKHRDIKKIKVGHAGTLDPLATGLLILCTGKYTKKIEALTGQDKEYVADITFGGTTPSFDLETEVDERHPWEHITQEAIQTVLETFRGKQYQTPPLFSAIRLDGKRAYEHARKGLDLKMHQREVEFHDLELLHYEAPLAKVRIRCSKGTYIRSFAKDLGEKLNSGAHLSGLIRTQSGNYQLSNALTPEAFENNLMNSKPNLA